jgi:hypothetical protein
MPDTDTSAVVVECVRQTMQLAAPTGVTGNYDSHIFFWPESMPQSLVQGEYIPSNPMYFTEAKSAGAGLITAKSETFNMPLVFQPYVTGGTTGSNTSYETYGLLNAVSVNAGADTMPMFPPTAPTQAAFQSLSPPAVLTSGKRRLIAAGWEVTNTTATIYQQGTLTAYRQPQAFQTVSALSMDNTSVGFYTNPGNSNMLMPYPTELSTYTQPPGQVGEAIQYEGSRQWAAAEGAYVVCQQDHSRNILKQSEMRYPWIPAGDYANQSNAGTRLVGMFNPAWEDDGSSSGWIVPTASLASYLVPYHTSGIFLTGLSNQSTFTVTLKTWWEYCPSVHDDAGSALIYLAQPSPDYDPLALELYKAASAQLPVAVPVGMNAAGDFWDWCLGAIATVAPIVGNVLLPGVGGLAGSAAAAGIRAGQAARNRNSEEKKKAPPARDPPDDADFKPAVKLLKAPAPSRVTTSSRRVAMPARAKPKLARSMKSLSVK